MNKRGSHVGVIMSFAIFVTFLAFLYAVVEPTTKVQKDKQFLISYLKLELIENFSANLTTSSIKVDDSFTITKSCIRFNNLRIRFPEGENLVIKDESGNILNYSRIGRDNLIIDIINPSNKFFRIYSSTEFQEGYPAEGTDCDNINENYIIGRIKTEKDIFATKIVKMINRHKNDYEALKDELKVPLGSEFGLGFTYSNGTIIKTEDKETKVNIYVEEIPIQYVGKEANINPGFLRIKMW